MRTLAALLLLVPAIPFAAGQALIADLPDEPGEQLLASQQDSGPHRFLVATGLSKPTPCTPQTEAPPQPGGADKQPATAVRAPTSAVPPICGQHIDLYEPFVNTQAITPMTPKQKGLLAIHNVIHPINLITVAGLSAITVAADSHSVYGPGIKGWARDSGYTLAQDAQSEAITTFAIASLAHEDPRYHRMPGAPIRRRLIHAFIHTYVSRHDDGRSMPNYETLIGYPIVSEFDDLWVPGIARNLKSTGTRTAIAIAGNPAADLITEFLPDVASHIHIQVVFVQRILNQVTYQQPLGQLTP